MSTRSWMKRGALFGVLALGSVGCEPAAEGEVRVTLSGGDGTQRGYNDHLFQDGWSVQFTKYLVSVGDFTLTSATGEKRTAAGQVLVDVQKGDMPLAHLEGLAAGRWSVGFRVAPPGADTTLPDGNVSPADLELMRAKGYSYWVEGIATKANVGVYTFRMGFPVNARMVDCVNGVDGTLGIVVPENSVAQTEVTIHAEHMFYDRLGTHRGVLLRFDALAATANADKVITPEGLASQRLLDLRDAQGRELKDAQGKPVVYEPGAYTVKTLQEFVTQSIVDQAHLNGGGVCTVAHEG